VEQTSFRVSCSRRLIGCQLHFDGTVQENGDGPVSAFSFTAIMGVERDAQVIVNISRDNPVYRHLIESDFETARGMTTVLQMIVAKALQLLGEKHPLPKGALRRGSARLNETFGMDILYVTDGEQASRYLGVIRQCRPVNPRPTRPVTPEA
jgi:hypothetical protein